jgi:hypothetical protein
VHLTVRRLYSIGRRLAWWPVSKAGRVRASCAASIVGNRTAVRRREVQLSDARSKVLSTAVGLAVQHLLQSGTQRSSIVVRGADPQGRVVLIMNNVDRDHD